VAKRSSTGNGSIVAARQSPLEIRQLRAFLALIEHERITVAAQALGLAQSTVSESILALERALGAPVFHRRRGNKTHQARLTEVGRALLPHARDVLAAVERAHAGVAAATAAARASLLIVANESVSTYVLPAAAARVRSRWPNVRVSISVGTCAEIRKGVTDGTFDIGVRLDFDAPGCAPAPAAYAAITRRVLAPVVPLIAFARPFHPLAGGTVVTREDLESFPVFVSDAAGDFHELLTQALADQTGRPPRVESTGSVEAVKKAVCERPTGIGILPAHAIAEELRLGTFAAIHLRPALQTLRIEAWTMSTRESHPVLRDLLEALGDSCKHALPERPVAVGAA